MTRPMRRPAMRARRRGACSSCFSTACSDESDGRGLSSSDAGPCDDAIYYITRSF